MRARLWDMVRQRAAERVRARGGPEEPDRETADAFAARVHAELLDAYPDEDLGEDLGELLEHREWGNDPGSEEEAELLEAVREAQGRLARGQ